MTKLSVFAGIFIGSLLAIQAGGAAAHGSFPFDDPYWKRPADLTTVQQPAAVTEAAKQNKKYDLVDNYNP